MKESRLPNSRVSDNQNLEEVVVRRLSPHGQRLLLEPGGRLPSLSLPFLFNPPTNVFTVINIQLFHVLQLENILHFLGGDRSPRAQFLNEFARGDGTFS